MTPFVSPSHHPITEAFLPILALCKRLDTWDFGNNKTPLIRFTEEFVRRLCSNARQLQNVFLYVYDQVSLTEISKKDSSLYQKHQVDFYFLLERSFRLLQLCLEIDTGREEDILLALFVIQKGSGNDTKTQSAYDKQISTYIREAFNRYRLDMDVVRLQSNIEDSCDTLLKFVSIVSDIISPQYIHSYIDSNQTPYKVDAIASPSSGAFGIVRKVIHADSGREFAQKTFLNIFSDAERDEVIHEISVLAVCKHRNIVQLVGAYELGTEFDTIHVVIEPWAPYTLHQFLHSSDTTRQVRCPWFRIGCHKTEAIILRLMWELSTAMEYLHFYSIKHKDLKPDNILLHKEDGADVTPVITDVGRSKVFSFGAITDYNKQGAYEFLAPEQIRLTESSLKVDIWQLGCCYALLLAVTVGGTSSVRQLWKSFQDTESHASCNIASEYATFMPCFENICISANKTVAWQRACSMVKKMLCLDSAARVNIAQVQQELFGILEIDGDNFQL